MSEKIKIMVAKTAFLHPITKKNIRVGQIVGVTEGVPEKYLENFQPGNPAHDPK